jgi:hypothetical protein
MTRIWSVLLLVLLALLLAAPPAVAREPMALGHSSASSTSMRVVGDLTAWVGARPALWSLWSRWGARGGRRRCLAGHGTCAFPTAAARGLQARGITPLVWWTPTGPADEGSGRYGRSIRIIRGRHDAYIRDWARAARDLGGPVILRFAHEMNGQWYPWGLGRFDNGPGRFRRAWRHVWRLFQEVGATNVRFLWSPMPEGCDGCRPDYRLERFYPGDRYVDYVGLTVFNWGRRDWTPLVRILERPLRRLRQVTATDARPGGKPVIIPELASNHEGGDKARWIRRGYRAVYERWPRVRALVYFDMDLRNEGDPDWRLVRPNDGSAAAAYRDIAARREFKGRLR